jgi:crotonobetainyl-CoA:carnitine CoA-transferase CaiB-like acyl-CoA transferase
MGKKVLEGVKVLDFGWVLAAPLATKQLAIQGATVIKVESSTHPDTVRLYAPNAGGIRGINRCGAFSAYNDDKMSIALDLRKPKALDIVKKLVAWCDIVIENFSPGYMEKKGLGWENLKQMNPDVIMLSISMQGQTGPRASIPGFGGAFQAQVGIIELVGWPDQEPDTIPIAFTDHVLPWYAAFIAIAALEYRDRTGKGLHLDIGQYETGLNCLIPAALDYTVNGRIWTRAGNRLPYASPHSVYRCQGDDRWVSIAVFSDKEWHAFTKVIGEPDWTKSPKFSTFLARKQNEDELDRLVESWTANHTAEDVMKMMQESGVAAGLVETNKDLHEDPQLAHRKHFVKLNHPEMGLCAYDDSSFRLSKTPAELKSPSPCLGEHTEYVLTDILGMSDEEFVTLNEEGIFT